MDVIFGLLIIIFIFVLFRYLKKFKDTESKSAIRPNKYIDYLFDFCPSKEKMCEIEVSDVLRKLGSNNYCIFNNLILPSTGNTPHTEIDHTIVSPFGIFCIETKSDKGSIYGSSKNSTWKKYLFGEEYDFPNPFRQNYKHRRAIEEYLGSNLKSPVHSYVVFPNAYKVRIDGQDGCTDADEILKIIKTYNQKIYDEFEYERIVSSLKFMDDKKRELSTAHINEVRTFLNTNPYSR